MEKRIKVGLFIDTFFPMVDGVISVVDNYARKLQKHCDVVVFCPNGRKKFDDSNLPYQVVRCTHKFPMVGLDYDLPTPSSDRKFKKILNESNLDIVHIHSPFSMGKVGIKYAKKHNIPAVATMHSAFREDFRKAVGTKWFANVLLKIIIKVFNSCDECWTMNNFSRELFKEYGCTTSIDIIPNASSLISSKNKDELSQIADEYYSLRDDFVMLFVGRLNKLKNIDLILDSVAKLNKNINYKLVLVGSGKDEDYFKQKVAKLKLKRKVIFAGKITNKEKLAELYARADLFLFPSKYDTDGIVKIEAAGFSTPSLCLLNTGAGSSITNDVNGFLCEETKEDIFNNLAKIINMPKEDLSIIGDNAKRDIFATWESVVDMVYNGYMRLINNREEKKECKKN